MPPLIENFSNALLSSPKRTLQDIHGNSCEALLMAEQASVEQNSNIVDFYSGRTVFITGASGFIGKVLIEKLLRTCPLIKRIYVLIRPKRGKSPEERLEELLGGQLFESCRKRAAANGQLSLAERVVAIGGDVAQDNLGMSEQSWLQLSREVSVIFNSAATVRFDEPLKQAIAINIVGTKNVVEFARCCGSRLASFVHVSTAYANCDRQQVDEHVYPTDMDPDKLIQLASWLDGDTLQELKVRLLKNKPNTYTYSKALAEWLLVKSARDLPLVICRPSIVVAASSEPYTGWIDNLNGPTGIIAGTAKGLIRSIYGQMDCVVDAVPVDYVINLMLALAWFAHISKNTGGDFNGYNYEDEAGDDDQGSSDLMGTLGNLEATTSSSTTTTTDDSKLMKCKLKQFKQRTRNKLIEHQLPEELADVPVFHCTSGGQNPISWGQGYAFALAASTMFPCTTTWRYPCQIFTNNKLIDKFYRLTSHYMPGVIFDLVSVLFGRKPVYCKLYEKFDRAALALEPFMTQQWNFTDDNSLFLMNELMNGQDKRLFNFDMSSIDWQELIVNYVLGIRQFIFKEPMDNVARARANLTMTYYRNLCLQVLGVATIAYFCRAIFF